MRAVLVDNNRQGAEKLYVGEAPTPKLDSGEVLVKIKAFGLNRMDILQREGQYPVPPGASQILGVEFSGIVEELGPDTGKWKVGDEVLGLATGVSGFKQLILPSKLLG
ncbi:9438_t:CDS:2 [Acaulospora colombiana]|uniref:9438_t:CDS:1 n=1 Tax=Acaulospora colombiana TaxID=27376 RepID=A0ACA9PZH1_9GLOM|nr:9438_t:CDS:2 [Acaulospora colombiana]